MYRLLFVFKSGSVFVAFTVAEIFHEGGWRVSDVQGNRKIGKMLDIFLDVLVGRVELDGFWRVGHVGDALRNDHAAFGHADGVRGLVCGNGLHKCLWVGKANVFACEANEATGEVERLFASFEHASGPVERGICIASTHGFMERGNDVVVFLASFVVQQCIFFYDFCDGFLVDFFFLTTFCFEDVCDKLEHIESISSVAVCDGCEKEKCFVGEVEVEFSEALLFIE